MIDPDRCHRSGRRDPACGGIVQLGRGQHGHDRVYAIRPVTELAAAFRTSAHLVGICDRRSGVGDSPEALLPGWKYVSDSLGSGEHLGGRTRAFAW